MVRDDLHARLNIPARIMISRPGNAQLAGYSSTCPLLNRYSMTGTRSPPKRLMNAGAAQSGLEPSNVGLRETETRVLAVEPQIYQPPNVSIQEWARVWTSIYADPDFPKLFLSKRCERPPEFSYSSNQRVV